MICEMYSISVYNTIDFGITARYQFLLSNESNNPLSPISIDLIPYSDIDFNTLKLLQVGAESLCLCSCPTVVEMHVQVKSSNEVITVTTVRSEQIYLTEMRYFLSIERDGDVPCRATNGLCAAQKQSVVCHE